MSAGADERLGREGVFRSAAAAPGAAMDEDIHTGAPRSFALPLAAVERAGAAAR